MPWRSRASPSSRRRRDLVARFPCPEDGRATNARLTDAGWAKILAIAPGHVQIVRPYVIDALTREQIAQLSSITEAMLTRLDPTGALTATYLRPGDPQG